MTLSPTARRAAYALIAGLSLGPGAGFGQDGARAVDPAERLGLVLYQDGRAIVTDRRAVDLAGGPAMLRFADLLPGIDPLTVSASAAAPARVERVTVHGETLSAAALTARLVGQEVLFARALPGDGGERIESARLIAAGPDLILDFGGQVEANPPGRLVFDRVPDDLAAAPAATLSLDSDGAVPAADPVLTYQTSGLDWRAEYDLTLDGKRGRLAGWAVLRNATGRALSADVALIAGDVARVGGGPRPMMRAEMAMADAAAAAPAPAPAAAEGRYVYRLAEPVAMPAGGVVREALIPAADVAVERLYRLRGSPGPASHGPDFGTEPLRPALFARIDNSAANNLGLPLPAGVARLMHRIDGGPVAVLGEDRIPHTAPEGRLELSLGRAFDITAAREVLRFRRLDARGAFEAETRITVANPTDTDIRVELRERFAPQSRILSESQDRAEAAAGLAVWRLDVPAGGGAALTYAIRVQP